MKQIVLILILVNLTACTSYKQVVIASDQPVAEKLKAKHTYILTHTDQTRHKVKVYQLKDNEVIGKIWSLTAGGTTSRMSSDRLLLTDIQKVEVRKLSGWKNAVLFGTVILILFLLSLNAHFGISGLKFGSS